MTPSKTLGGAMKKWFTKDRVVVEVRDESEVTNVAETHLTRGEHDALVERGSVVTAVVHHDRPTTIKYFNRKIKKMEIYHVKK